MRIFLCSDKGQLHCDFKYAPFARENRKSINEVDEKLVVSNIKSALESTVCLHEFPNYQVDVFILVLEDDGAVLSTSITAAGMAFIDASVPCYDICSSSSLAITSGRILIDPTGIEEEVEDSTVKDHGTMIISSLCSMDQVSQVLFKGFIDASLLKKAYQQLLELNKSHSMYLKKVLSLKVSRDYIEI